MSDLGIYPNRVTTFGDLEIHCYGEELIMVDHPQITPLPLGPSRPLNHEYAEGTDHPEFWDRDPERRAEIVLDAVDDRLNWEGHFWDISEWIGKDITHAREALHGEN